MRAPRTPASLTSAVQVGSRSQIVTRRETYCQIQKAYNRSHVDRIVNSGIGARNLQLIALVSM